MLTGVKKKNHIIHISKRKISPILLVTVGEKWAHDVHVSGSKLGRMLFVSQEESKSVGLLESEGIQITPH